MTSSLGDLYTQAVNSGDTSSADYYAQALYAAANPGASIANVTAAPAALVNGASASNASGVSWLDNLFGANTQSLNISPETVAPSPTISGFLTSPLQTLDTLIGSLFTPNTPAGAPVTNSATGVTSPATGATTSSASAALSFITDIPRVAVTVIGLLFIVAGIFSLSRGNNIIQMAAP